MRLALPLCALALFAACDRPGASPPAPIVTPAPRAFRPEPSSPVGTNLADVRNHAPGLAFTDVFKESSPFDDPDLDDPDGRSGTNLVQDPHGWVVSFPGRRYWTVMRRELDGGGGGRAHYPAGDYRFTYRGRGTFAFRNDAALVRDDPDRGEAIVRVAEPTTGGILLEVTATDSSDPLREMSLIPTTAAGGRDGARFNPWFLDSLRGFSVLRFMDWQGTNGSREERFDARTTPASQTQAAERGVAVEHMIELANELGADPWFCMPHRADDDYVARFARLVHERLAPGLAVWVEYSNEVWNGGFEQSAYASEQGRARGYADPGAHFYAARSVEIFAIWEREMGGTERVRRVLASQNANPAVSEAILDFEVPGRGAAYRNADYLAVAPYFDGLRSNACDPDDEVERLAAAAPEAILAIARRDVERTLALAAEHRRLAEARRNAEGRPLRLVAYEGGPHLVGACGAENVAPLTAALVAANRSAEIGAIYGAYLDGWKRLGGELFVHFTSTAPYTKWGSWGFREWYDQPSAPKLDALRAFAARSPRWWRE
jgi:hypothetical protein